MSTIADNLKNLGVALPQPPTPLASYVGFVRQDDLVFVSGQLAMQDGAISQTGLLGAGVSIEEGMAAAKNCAINILAQVNIACEGDLERI